MRYEGVYKTYKLYSVTEQDIVESGGGDTSRYINNSVLVFLPDIEKPEIGTELLSADSITTAKTFVDRKHKKPMKEVMEQAIQKSAERAAQQHIDQEEERRRRERITDEYNLETTQSIK